MSDKMPVLKLVSDIIENLDEKPEAQQITARKKKAARAPKEAVVALLPQAVVTSYPREMRG